jgi:myo-inositol 2-dehydrogenase/D-chiro-inositol 1-dehydrogenase
LAGRMAAYSGQTITYDQAQNSSEIFFDDSLTLESKYDLSIAIPGITEFK